MYFYSLVIGSSTENVLIWVVYLVSMFFAKSFTAINLVLFCTWVKSNTLFVSFDDYLEPFVCHAQMKNLKRSNLFD